MLLKGDCRVHDQLLHKGRAAHELKSSQDISSAVSVCKQRSSGNCCWQAECLACTPMDCTMMITVITTASMSDAV